MIDNRMIPVLLLIDLGEREIEIKYFYCSDLLYSTKSKI